MIKSARNKTLLKSKIKKNLIRHNSQKRLFIQKKNTSISKETELSARSIVKSKKAPLSNLPIMRSQTNLSLSKLNKNSLTRISKDFLHKETIKSPDLTYKTSKLSFLQTMNKVEDSSFNVNHLVSSKAPRAKQNNSEYSIETSTLKNIQFNSKHNRIPSYQISESSRMESQRKCRKCAVLKHVSKKTIIDLNEQIQYYMLELLKKEGLVTVYEEEALKMAEENESLKKKVTELENSLQKVRFQDNKENVPGNLQKEIEHRIKHKNVLRNSKSKLLIQKKEYDDQDILGAAHRRGSSEISIVKATSSSHKRTESSDTSYLLSSMKKRNGFMSREEDLNKSNTSSDDKSTQKMEHPDEDMYQTVLTRHNNYDLKPYFTEVTNNEERIPAPIMMNDNSPLITKGKVKNQKFDDFQKHLSSKLGLKPRKIDSHIGKRLKVVEGNQSIDMNPMTVESSVKSVIFKETPTNTVPSSFVDAEMQYKYKKPPIPSEGLRNYQNCYMKPEKQSMSIYDISSSGTFVQKDSTTDNDQLLTYGPEPPKGIKASIGGEEFVMYRTEELRGRSYMPRDDDNDSVEIEM
ncbi:unnamed protein product [Moneuplotes crassus]|uniref:Uncharacterized protein n=1 Tax=Euplotes crassus TaxID=5936 RepID=A0AAD1U5Z6_EUPCR|nr:unnamed protein product [Moneuplotes crassus]